MNETVSLLPHPNRKTGKKDLGVDNIHVPEANRVSGRGEDLMRQIVDINSKGRFTKVEKHLGQIQNSLETNITSVHNQRETCYHLKGRILLQ